jgi:flagellar basal-body rod protein FlgG
MYTGLYTAVAGGLAQEKRLNVLTNNLANATTAGFKAEHTIFQGFLQPIVVGPVTVTGADGPVVTAVDPLAIQHTPSLPQVSVQTDFSQGPLQDTGNPLDLALEGKGFFVVENPAGQMCYTRQGTFSLNADGVLVTQQGLPVQGQQGAITIRGSKVEIDQTGQVFVNGKAVDRLKLVDISPTSGLEKAGDALFRAVGPDTVVQDASGVTVHQRVIEGSNSQLIRLMGSLIQTSRAYEAYQKVIQIFDETAGRAVNDVANTR